MTSTAVNRLMEERKNWRKDRPYGFYAKPIKKTDGSTDMMVWELGIPGKEGSDWEGGTYKIKMRFSQDYPLDPPSCKFDPKIFHPNVFTDGSICIDILKESWRPSINLKQIALALQELLTNPNPKSPANGDANNMLTKHPSEYAKKIRLQAVQNAPVESDEVM